MNLDLFAIWNVWPKAISCKPA